METVQTVLIIISITRAIPKNLLEIKMLDLRECLYKPTQKAILLVTAWNVRKLVGSNPSF